MYSHIAFVARSENLTGLGGSMGTEHTSTNWRRYFKSLANAKAYAQYDYQKQIKDASAQLDWIKVRRSNGKTGYRTQDMGFVMYHIDPIFTED